MTLLDMVRKYQDLLTEKDRLSDLTKRKQRRHRGGKG